MSAYTNEDIQLLIAQEQSRHWRWDKWSEVYKDMRIIDCMSHRGTGKVRGDRGGNKVRVDKARWKEMGRRRRRG